MIKRENDKCIFMDEPRMEEVKELILFGYRLLPLASDGILAVKGGELICIHGK